MLPCSQEQLALFAGGKIELKIRLASLRTLEFDPKFVDARTNATYYLLPTTYYLLPLSTTYCLLSTTYYLLPTTYCLLSTATICYLLPTAYYLLPTTYYLRPDEDRGPSWRVTLRFDPTTRSAWRGLQSRGELCLIMQSPHDVAMLDRWVASTGQLVERVNENGL